MKIALAQLNTHVGAISTNAKKILATAMRARDEFGCDLVVFPELTLSGYPPEDLLLHRGMRLRVDEALEEVRAAKGFAVEQNVSFRQIAPAQPDNRPAARAHDRNLPGRLERVGREAVLRRLPGRARCP